MNPYLSIVVAARNDDYGGNFLHRMSVFLKVLLALSEKHRLSAELLVVDWNPPPDKPSLAAVFREAARSAPAEIRFIQVPSEIHRRMLNAERMPMFEYIGKNVGIRRARGRFVLSTNPDIVFNEPLIQFFASRALDPQAFYRVDRFDVDWRVPLEEPVQRQLRFCADHTIRINRKEGTFPTWRDLRAFFSGSNLNRMARQTAAEVLFRGNAANGTGIHGNASGDFLLMGRDHWHALRGYPELKTHSHIDTYGCFLAQSLGLKQIALKPPRHIYHQEHDRSEQAKRPQTSFDEIHRLGKKMLETGRPEITNDENWGLGDQSLPEERGILNQCASS